MPRSVDALVVGGGPAGLAAAIVLGQAGLRVILCERQQYPIDKVCGEGLMPTGVRHLAALGVEVCERFAFRGVRYISPEGVCAEGQFREGSGWGVRRTVLSQALLARARRVPSLCVKENVEATVAAVNEAGVEVTVEQEQVRARLVVGADGLHSPLRRWASLDKRGRRHLRWGARQHFAVQPWSDCVEVYWSGRGVEAYVTPVGAAQVGIAFLWHRGGYRQLRGGEQLVPSLLAAFPTLQARLRGARPLSAGRAVGPLQQRVHGMVSDGLLLIGDAAGYVDAITGEGLSLALAQALALRETVVPLLQRGAGIVTRKALAPYGAASATAAKGTMQVTELALLLSRYPALCNRTVRALARDASLFEDLLAANMGLQPVLRSQTVWRLVWGLLGAVS